MDTDLKTVVYLIINVEQDTDCPFYLSNINYTNRRGGCKDDGFCELPVNVKSLSYKHYDSDDPFYPYCYGCPDNKMKTCCDVQKNIRWNGDR